ncbi:MAG: methyltransferase domain-containing protein [Candidatus Binatia bacterium]
MASTSSASRQTYRPVSCLVCQHPTIEQFLDLGQTALANKFLVDNELAVPEPAYPLRVGFCHTCSHVQLTSTVSPAAMFEDYLYISSASDALKAHLYEVSDLCVERYRLRAGDLVIDIGCNDGTLLSGFRRHGVKTLGVDPAANLAIFARETGIERYVGFFNATTATRIRAQWGPASVITATNTFPHIPELRDFVRGIDTVLAPGGVFVIEAHYLVDLLEQCAFDTIYHEHVSYWAIGPMCQLFAQQGMEIVHAERVPLHHGQVRVAVQRQGEGVVQPSVAEMLELERRLGLNDFSTYRHFAQHAGRLKRELRRTLLDLQREGQQIAAYGAPAKGNTLLSFLELTPGIVNYIADRSPLKQGKYTPGTHIPVVSPQRLLTDQPDYVVLLAWNFLDEVLAQQAEYRRRGGKFIIPVPQVQIL